MHDRVYVTHTMGGEPNRIYHTVGRALQDDDCFVYELSFDGEYENTGRMIKKK